jgi:hypothetical protein
MRVKLGLPSHFTFDAYLHGGMTELEQAELTDGQGRALSVHRTQQSYIGYAKRTEKRVLAATRKRHATGWRTKWRQTFRMRSRKPFRMKHRNKVRLPSKINWLGREGSNLRMAESKSAALPLGYAPKARSGQVRIRPTGFPQAPPVYRDGCGISTGETCKFLDNRAESLTCSEIRLRDRSAWPPRS